MPLKEEQDIKRVYYTMGEVSSMFNVNQSLLRYYEKEFDILKPKKNQKGNRFFTPEDIENLKVIMYLIREKGYTIPGAREYMKNNLNATKETQRMIDKLEEMKKFLLGVRDQL